uniref:BHLH domain-containing protein n=1 Tax=Prolemur simus TaxID=1328070 RepID=A0A8C9DIJ5_PROSS
MASRDPEPDAGVPRVLSSGGCSVSSSEALSCGEDPAPSSGPATAPPVAEGPSPRLPRNVLSERERRKRISMSCEHLRALLPRFHGRREDMASVLEMAVQFIRLARTLVPGQEQHVFAPSKETWHSLQKNVLQLALSCQVPAGTPGLGTGVSVVTVLVSPVAHPAGLGCLVSLPVCLWSVPCILPTPGASLCSGSGVLAGPRPEPSSLAPPPAGLAEVPRPPSPWPCCPRQLTSPVMSEEAPSWLGHAGPLARAATPLAELVEEALVPAPDARSVSASDGEDKTSFLLTASPDWWPGEWGCVWGHLL